jgi:hypothetical protein
MSLEGGCSCGAIRYKLTNTPLIVHACHCRDCQRVTGSGFVINIWIEKQFVESRGAMPKSVVLKGGGTGKDHEAFFCDKCGTYVWSRYAVAPGSEALFVRAGTLDNPDAVQPDVHIFTRSKLRWVRLPEGSVAFETAGLCDTPFSNQRGFGAKLSAGATAVVSGEHFGAGCARSGAWGCSGRQRKSIGYRQNSKNIST